MRQHVIGLPDEVYDLIRSTEDIALSTLPKKKNKSKCKLSHSPSVTQARIHLKSISLAYHRSPSMLLRIQLVEAKKKLDEAYLTAEADYINGKISQLYDEHIANKHRLAWKTISFR